MAQLQLKSLLGKVNGLLERGFEFFGYAIINKSEMENLLDECNKCIPADIKEAEMLLSRREEIVKEAEARAERIIQDAVAEQKQLISRDEVYKELQEVVANQKQQVEQYCENLQATAVREAEEIKVSAIRKAATIQEEAEDYAARIFANMGENISGFLNNIQACQNALANQRIGRQSRMEALANESAYPDQNNQYAEEEEQE